MKRFRYPRSMCLPAFLVLLLLAIPLALQAQDLTTSANLTGNVTDSSGAVIPRATVTVSGVDNGISRVVSTDASGNFSVSLLPPASYNLRVESKGFKAYQQKGITLIPDSTARQNVQLAVGSETEEVTVTSQAPLLNTGDANLSAEITGQQVEDLPLNLELFGVEHL